MVPQLQMPRPDSGQRYVRRWSSRGSGICWFYRMSIRIPEWKADKIGRRSASSSCETDPDCLIDWFERFKEGQSAVEHRGHKGVCWVVHPWRIVLRSHNSIQRGSPRHPSMPRGQCGPCVFTPTNVENLDHNSLAPDNVSNLTPDHFLLRRFQLFRN